MVQLEVEEEVQVEVEEEVQVEKEGEVEEVVQVEVEEKVQAEEEVVEVEQVQVGERRCATWPRLQEPSLQLAKVNIRCLSSVNKKKLKSKSVETLSPLDLHLTLETRVHLDSPSRVRTKFSPSINCLCLQHCSVLKVGLVDLLV